MVTERGSTTTVNNVGGTRLVLYFMHIIFKGTISQLIRIILELAFESRHGFMDWLNFLTEIACYFGKIEILYSFMLII